MKTTLRKIIATLTMTFVLLAANISFAQTRIEFAKGTRSATVKGTGKQSYVIHVGADQTVKIRLVSKGNKATFDFLDSAGSDLSEGSDGRSLEMGTATAGDYRINVQATKGVAFTLTVSVK